MATAPLYRMFDTQFDISWLRVAQEYMLQCEAQGTECLGLECTHSGHRVSWMARRTKLEFRCKKRQDGYIELAANKSPSFHPYLRARRIGHDFSNFVHWYIICR